MIGIVAILIAMLCIIRKKSNIVFIIGFLFLWTIMAFTYGDADENLYISRYNNPQIWIGQTEIIYALIMSVATKIGLTFYQYKAVITLIELLLICSTIKKMSLYPNVVLLCYMTVPFLLNVTQMRNALATAVFIYFCRYLFEGEGSCRKLKITKHIIVDYTDFMYVVGIMIATLIHSASIIWIVLLIAKKYSFKQCVYFTLITNIIFQFIITPQNIVRIISLVSKGAASRMISYTTAEYQKSEWRHNSQILYVALVGIFLIFIYCFILKRKYHFNVTRNVEIVLKINICILIILSLMLRYTQELYRLQEGLFVINYITITNTIRCKDMTSSRIKVSSFFVHILLSIYVLFSAWFLIFHYLIPTIVKPVLNNNYFWNLIL